MTEYQKRRIKQADICDCNHLNGSHAGTHFEVSLILMGFIIFSGLPLQYMAIDLHLITEEESAIAWGIIMSVGLYFIFFRFDRGCSFCTCKKFKWSGKNKYD